MTVSRKQKHPQQEILRILRENGGVQTAGALNKKALEGGIGDRQFFRHLRKLVDQGEIQKELLRDGSVEIEAYTIREPGQRRLSDLVCHSLGENFVDYLDNYDKDLDSHAKATKLATLLALVKEIDEAFQVDAIAAPTNGQSRRDIAVVSE